MWLAIWFGFVAISVLSVLFDVIRHPSLSMPIMNVVWPLVALYFGPLGLGMYWALSGRSITGHVVATPHLPSPSGHGVTRPGRAATTNPSTHTKHGMAGMNDPLWIRSARSSTHCMAGCALGDLTAMVLVEALGWVPLGTMMSSEIIVSAILAFVFGLFIFQAFPVMAERGIGFQEAFAIALKADTATITAYLVGQIPVFIWLTSLAGGHHVVTPVALVVMQTSMAVGFLTTYPMNMFLVSRGLKHGM